MKQENELKDKALEMLAQLDTVAVKLGVEDTPRSDEVEDYLKVQTGKNLLRMLIDYNEIYGNLLSALVNNYAINKSYEKDLGKFGRALLEYRDTLDELGEVILKKDEMYSKYIEELSRNVVSKIAELDKEVNENKEIPELLEKELSKIKTLADWEKVRVGSFSAKKIASVPIGAVTKSLDQMIEGINHNMTKANTDKLNSFLKDL